MRNFYLSSEEYSFYKKFVTLDYDLSLGYGVGGSLIPKISLMRYVCSVTPSDASPCVTRQVSSSHNSFYNIMHIDAKIGWDSDDVKFPHGIVSQAHTSTSLTETRWNKYCKRDYSSTSPPTKKKTPTLDRNLVLSAYRQGL